MCVTIPKEYKGCTYSLKVVNFWYINQLEVKDKMNKLNLMLEQYPIIRLILDIYEAPLIFSFDFSLWGIILLRFTWILAS